MDVPQIHIDPRGFMTHEVKCSRYILNRRQVPTVFEFKYRRTHQRLYFNRFYVTAASRLL